MEIHTGEFNGKCENCGGLAAIFPWNGTASIQRQDNREMSVVVLDRVSCERGHSYAVINWSTQVSDPFEEGYVPPEEN